MVPGTAQPHSPSQDKFSESQCHFLILLQHKTRPALKSQYCCPHTPCSSPTPVAQQKTELTCLGIRHDQRGLLSMETPVLAPSAGLPGLWSEKDLHPSPKCQDQPGFVVYEHPQIDHILSGTSQMFCLRSRCCWGLELSPSLGPRS